MVSLPTRRLLSTRRPLVAAVVVVALAVLAGGAMTRWRQSSSPAIYQGAFDGICSALAQAGAGQVADARRTFTDKVHDPVHDLAAKAIAAGQRGRAADLLEAKESVERLLANESAAGLAAPLDGLATATSAAMEAVDGRAPAPCRR